MQRPRPTKVTGVPVAINIVDSNGDYRQIGSVTSNYDGFFSLNRKPDIEGQHTVYASFGGSAAYWLSHVIPSFAVDNQNQPQHQPNHLRSATDINMLPKIIAIIVSILLVCVGLALLVVIKRQ